MWPLVFALPCGLEHLCSYLQTLGPLPGRRNEIILLLREPKIYHYDLNVEGQVSRSQDRKTEMWRSQRSHMSRPTLGHLISKDKTGSMLPEYQPNFGHALL